MSKLLAEVEEAKREQADVRAALARRAGLSEDATSDVLGARLRERTARLAAEGLTLELEFSGIDSENDEAPAPTDAAASTQSNSADAASTATIPSATLRTPGREPERRELRLLEVFAQAALSGATIYADMRRVERRVEHLLSTATELRQGVSAAFPDASRRETVQAKLTEAESFLPDLNRQALAVGHDADILIAVLDEAANTAPLLRRRPAREPAPTRDAPARDGVIRESATPERSTRRAPAKTAEREPAAASPERAKGDFEP